MELVKKVSVGVAAMIALGAATVFAQDDAESVADRLEPVGKVCMAGDDCTGGATQGATQLAAGESRDPEEIYQSKCFSCHNTGVGGAPKQDDAAAWQSRLDEKGLEKLYENAWNGINAMPPKGICTDCSREELNATVDYMLEKAEG